MRRSRHRPKTGWSHTVPGEKPHDKNIGEGEKWWQTRWLERDGPVLGDVQSFLALAGVTLAEGNAP